MGGRGSAGSGTGASNNGTLNALGGPNSFFGKAFANAAGSGVGGSSSSSGGSKGTAGAGTGGVQGGSGSSTGSTTSAPNVQGLPDGGNLVGGVLIFNQESKFRQWAATVWPDKTQISRAHLSELRLWTTNFGYQSVNNALRKVFGDVNELPNTDISTDWQGYTWDYTYGSQVTAGNISASDMAARIARLDAAIGSAPRVPQAIQVTRGTDRLEFNKLGITSVSTDADWLNLVGKKYTTDGYTAASLSSRSAMSNKQVQVTITLPKGHKGINLAGGKNHEGAISTLSTENEFLVTRGTTYKIIKVTKSGSNWEVEVVALPGSGI